jgi:hypothetical protein
MGIAQEARIANGKMEKRMVATLLEIIFDLSTSLQNWRSS